MDIGHIVLGAGFLVSAIVAWAFHDVIVELRAEVARLTTERDAAERKYRTLLGALRTKTDQARSQPAVKEQR